MERTIACNIVKMILSRIPDIHAVHKYRINMIALFRLDIHQYIPRTAALHKRRVHCTTFAECGLNRIGDVLKCNLYNMVGHNTT